MTLRKFIESNRVRFAAEMTDANPHMDSMPAGSVHWRCTLKVGRRSMVVYFSQGPAVCREPTAEDVLDCLASDASGYENAGSFEEWCGEYGYDTDSRKAEKTYKAIEKQCDGLGRLFSPDQFAALLSAERL
jgi:hypothetical protein